jgi:hypothetical protein
MRLIKYYILVAILVMWSCKPKANLENVSNLEDVMAFIIDAKAFPIPPPPPPSALNDTTGAWQLSKKFVDSLKSVKLKIGVHPILEAPIFNDKISLVDIPDPYKKLISQFSTIEDIKISTVKNINAKSRHSVVLADTLILKGSRDWKEYDLVFKFSNVAFNRDYNKAALSVGLSSSALAGYGVFYLLEKTKSGEWVIFKSYQLQEW